MKRLIIIVAVVLVALAVIFLQTQGDKQTAGSLAERVEESGTLTVAIASEIEIVPIAQLREGFRQEMQLYSGSSGVEIEYTEYNAAGDKALIAQIADAIATNPPDVIYVLGTSQAQAIQKRAPAILMVQGAVTDPVSAKLAESWDRSGVPYIATSDMPPIPRQIALIRTLTPHVRNLGVVYNPGETNSVAVIDRLKAKLKQGSAELMLHERAVTNTADVAQSVESLLGHVEAIYLPPDNTIYGAIKVIGKEAKDNSIPLYATTKPALEEGALATMALNFTELGRDSAKLLRQVLEQGADPAAMPIITNRNPTVYVNGERLKKLGLSRDAIREWHNVEIWRPQSKGS
uniref:Putative ABC transport system substrate-binding protein n=1 Tax=Candidatus Kentrum sp. FM TaxID=2126340 RepID=A0A450RZD9_9GAMM|nr:MAG: putative ABC transport system substrate-binding protein [Candidatus Kentron sp. FM]VFJ50396.1 MAG: putative ABC transport system substrate-binding protein [Candidatus Kentron sp. FM]VFK08678.1 MAG: putative ABC transport system substrate-binding protein [Candidatus Kentron sp. FM]